MYAVLRRFIPDTPLLSMKERLRAALACFGGVFMVGLGANMVMGGSSALPALIAPIGASAVLLFVVPSSPLAQPWSIIGGNTLSALVGVTCATLIGDTLTASAAALGLSILAMMTLRCLHPPGGAIALSAVLGGPIIRELGYDFVLWPVLGHSAMLLALALVFNNLMGRSYPHVSKPAAVNYGTSDPPPIERIGFTSEDLDEVLKSYDEFLDIDRDELEHILRQTEFRSYRRRASDLDCSSVMSRDVVTIEPSQTPEQAHNLMRTHHFKALPVIDVHSNVIGIVTQTDLLEKLYRKDISPSNSLRRRLHRVLSREAAPSATISNIMTSPVTTVGPDTRIADAMLVFAQQGLHYLPVTTDGKLQGILSQSDVMVAMLADKAIA